MDRSAGDRFDSAAIAALDSDGHLGLGGLLRLRVDFEAVGVLGRNARSNWNDRGAAQAAR